MKGNHKGMGYKTNQLKINHSTDCHKETNSIAKSMGGKSCKKGDYEMKYDKESSSNGMKY